MGDAEGEKCMKYSNLEEIKFFLKIGISFFVFSALVSDGHIDVLHTNVTGVQEVEKKNY